MLHTLSRALWWRTDELYDGLVAAGYGVGSLEAFRVRLCQAANQGWIERRPPAEYRDYLPCGGQRGQITVQWRLSEATDLALRARRQQRRGDALARLRRQLPSPPAHCPRCGQSLPPAPVEPALAAQ